MLLPSSNGYRYLAQGRCSISGWPEWRMFTNETAAALGNFVFEEVLCRWGAVVEIITDNGSAWVKAIEWLSKRYGINHIKVSGYNSHANGIVECRHYDVREAISKACEGDLQLWTEHVFYVFWAERVSIQKL
jgi:transposase InsO family protein